MGKPNPVCTGDCAEIWPPYILSADEAKDLQAPLGSIERANKKIQLTYNDRPVYIYAFDRMAGDDMGDGIGNVWHYIDVTPE
jgi:predicted lipoprotein with Yx(FWY)xxD motif